MQTILHTTQKQLLQLSIVNHQQQKSGLNNVGQINSGLIKANHNNTCWLVFHECLSLFIWSNSGYSCSKCI